MANVVHCCSLLVPIPGSVFLYYCSPVLKSHGQCCSLLVPIPGSVFLYYCSPVLKSHGQCCSLLVPIPGSVFLYYCSPVLKSLMAKVLSALETTRVKRLSDLPLFYERACWLVRVLAQGQFLPAPLSSMGELFPFITPYEGYLLLVTVWRYIKENPPTLSVDQMECRKSEPHHLQVMQAVLNANIHTMGHLYPRIFNT
ncbi:hypothetical protein ACOMHN_016033 [Nucella lapillus]